MTTISINQHVSDHQQRACELSARLALAVKDYRLEQEATGEPLPVRTIALAIIMCEASLIISIPDAVLREQLRCGMEKARPTVLAMAEIEGPVQ